MSGIETGSPRQEVDVMHEERICRDPRTGELGVVNIFTGRALFNRDMDQALRHVFGIYAELCRIDTGRGKIVDMKGAPALFGPNPLELAKKKQ